MKKTSTTKSPRRSESHSPKAKEKARFFHGQTSINLALAGAMVLVGWGLMLAVGELSRGGNTLAGPNQVFAAPAKVVEAPTLSGRPVHITVPVSKVDLAVAEGKYNLKTKQWTLSTDKAHFAEMSAPANDKSGNTFIYGHYRAGVFLNLKKLRPGDLAVVKTDNGHTFTYKLRTSLVVDPADSSPFSYQGPSILTLQTCTGALFQNRQLFIFDFVEAV